MRDYYTVKINLPGGIVSPGDLHHILTAAHDAGVRRVQFGARQQLLLTVHAEQLRFLERSLSAGGFFHETGTDQFPNLISSYCAEEVFVTRTWLSESTYQDVLEGFQAAGFRPRLKINVSDNRQSFTPFFTGNLNFIASKREHFWFLYVRLKQSNQMFRWPVLVFTNEIPRLSRGIETAMLNGGLRDEPALVEAVTSAQAFVTEPIRDELVLPRFMLPYYEGFNRYGAKTWLGIYRRDEQFSVAFLLDLCRLCQHTKIGQLCVTPWKSLIIKNIDEADRDQWSRVLGRHNVNVRHAANELCWQTEDGTDEGAALKQRVLRYFDRHDTRTFGLCFGIQTRPKSEVFGSVLVRKRPLLRLGGLALLSRYDILFTDEFNPNSRRYFTFATGLWRMHVPGQLERLCRKFSARNWAEVREEARPEAVATPVFAEEKPARLVHECPHCLTVYDPAFGDERNNVAPGVAFDELPETYVCPTCEAPKAEFRAAERAPSATPVR
jgi:rubredoxin